MPLINCKVELKYRWTNHCVLSVAGTDSANGNNADSNIFFCYKRYKIICSFTSERQSKTIKTSK